MDCRWNSAALRCTALRLARTLQGHHAGTHLGGHHHAGGGRQAARHLDALNRARTQRLLPPLGQGLVLLLRNRTVTKARGCASCNVCCCQRSAPPSTTWPGACTPPALKQERIVWTINQVQARMETCLTRSASFQHLAGSLQLCEHRQRAAHLERLLRAACCPCRPQTLTPGLNPQCLTQHPSPP